MDVAQEAEQLPAWKLKVWFLTLQAVCRSVLGQDTKLHIASYVFICVCLRIWKEVQYWIRKKSVLVFIA